MREFILTKEERYEFMKSAFKVCNGQDPYNNFDNIFNAFEKLGELQLAELSYEEIKKEMAKYVLENPPNKK